MDNNITYLIHCCIIIIYITMMNDVSQFIDSNHCTKIGGSFSNSFDSYRSLSTNEDVEKLDFKQRIE